MASNVLETTSFAVLRNRTSHGRVNVVSELFTGQTTMRKVGIACKLLTYRHSLWLNSPRTNRQINGSDGGEEQVDT